MADVENGDQMSDTMSVRTVGSHFGDDGESSFGSDSELNGSPPFGETDKYGFIGGAQKYSAESAQEVPPEVLRQRELKWLEMLKDWDKWINKRFKKVRLRCQKGIPPSMRGRAWLYLSGGKVKRERNSETFKELDSREGDPKWVDVIERDLHRQFPFHEMFVSRGGHGQQDLLRVLKAYTLYRPDEGYCQAQAPIAADAFWGLVQICEKYLPGYYSAGLEAVQLDGEILHSLLKRVCPVAYRHLDKHKIEPVLYMMEWFMCAFSRTLPWASVLRVWDMFLCDGVKIIFRVGLVLLKSMLGSRDKLKACPGQYETMEVLELPVSARDVEREHRRQLKRWMKKRGEPSRKLIQRMHSARDIMATEPHTRHDLHQNPTIIVRYPSIPEENSEPSLRKKRGTLKKNQTPVPSIPNPYALPSQSKHDQVSETQPLNQENPDAIPPHPPTLPPPLPPNQENQLKDSNTFTEPLVQTSWHYDVNQKPPESLPIENLSLLTAPVDDSTSEWRPHLLDLPPVQFRDPSPDHDDLHNNTENSAAILNPSPDKSPVLKHNAPVRDNSSAAPQGKNGALFNSAESINSSEDTYL
ncbi:TBC1 domain family member 10A [Silurus asotus]|uniref:TBC1 domain family member 10A n=1 Tax=Silurus asotus TaxID=30991 RepID=A0AAD5ASQ6_SILAS|nr:TBC1 domain family member 10A [Silurus asotus]